PRTEGPTHPAPWETRGAWSVGLGIGKANEARGDRRGGVPEWPKGADCKSAGDSLRRFESFPHHSFERAGVAQLVEHQPSKLRVAGSSPVARLCSRSSVGRARPW